MKKNILQVLLIIMMIAFFDACQKDSTNDPGVATTDRDKFLGTWSVHSTGTLQPLTNDFTMTITAGSSSASQIKINNFENEGASTTTFAEVSGNSISIPLQYVSSDSIQGTGTYASSNTLTLNYTLRFNGTVDNRTATAHK